MKITQIFFLICGAGSLCFSDPIEIQCAFPDSKQIPLLFPDNSGLVKDFTNELNSIQTKYRFNLKLYPAERLRTELQSGAADIALFHNRNWGWDLTKVTPSSPLLPYSEQYIAPKKPKRTQTVFDSIGRVPAIGVLGFSYRFSNYSLDQKELREKYNLTLVLDEMTVIEMLEANRGQLGVVTSGLLDWLKIHDPNRWKKLLISEIYDSKYVREFIVSSGSPISAAEFNRILAALEKSGRLRTIFLRYGLQPQKLAGH